MKLAEGRRLAIASRVVLLCHSVVIMPNEAIWLWLKFKALVKFRSNVACAVLNNLFSFLPGERSRLVARRSSPRRAEFKIDGTDAALSE